MDPSSDQVKRAIAEYGVRDRDEPAVLVTSASQDAKTAESTARLPAPGAQP